MKIRVAVYSRTRNFWGGSFQYAKAVTEALALLDPARYEVQVWHEDDADWNAVCAANKFTGHTLGDYVFPREMRAQVAKISELLARLPNSEAEERGRLLARLRPFSADALLDKYDPHILINPQMGNPRYHAGARHIGVIHDLMHRYEKHFPEVGAPSEQAAREHLFREMVARCGTILVDSRTGARHVMECYSAARQEQLEILPFTAFPEVIAAAPVRPSLPLPEKFIFYPAQFWLHKNHAGLARAAALLRAQTPDLAIVAAGNTSQNGYEPFMDIVRANGIENSFVLPGYVSAGEINWLYRHARAFVMPTFFGPTNIPPLEAMALGCPVAVSGIYGMPEQYGDAALYFNPGKPEEIADAIKKLWRDDELCARLKDKGLKRARLYDEAKFARRVAKIVEKAASGGEAQKPR